ncbi:MAG: PIG-L deacetylase family protein [Steroidobacteraceae bacterium]
MSGGTRLARDGQQLEARLARGEIVSEPVAVVVAHPDDEILWMGSRLGCLARLRLIHITDGAPRDMVDAHRAGLETWRQYAAARRLELYCALKAIQAQPQQYIAYDIADQESAQQLVPIIERLTAEISGMHAVITHSYEHGHPDHDSAALAVHAARAQLERKGELPPHLIEFASYHARDGRLCCGEFWSRPDVAEAVVSETADSRESKRRALDCFVSQRHVLQQFVPEHERLRPAPAYDFTQPAPPGQALYDAFGWKMTSPLWRTRARQTLQHLTLSGPL